MRAVDRVQVVGKSEVVTIYEVYEAEKRDRRAKKEELQSIESEAINIYKKVQEMNQDELRTLVMTDQM